MRENAGDTRECGRMRKNAEEYGRIWKHVCTFNMLIYDKVRLFCNFGNIPVKLFLTQFIVSFSESKMIILTINENKFDAASFSDISSLSRKCMLFLRYILYTISFTESQYIYNSPWRERSDSSRIVPATRKPQERKDY